MSSIIQNEGNPGRPTVSSVNCHTSSISQYIDHKLQPHVKELKSYVKVSSDFIQKTNDIENIPGSCILVIMDAPFNTKITNNEGLKAVKSINQSIIIYFTVHKCMLKNLQGYLGTQVVFVQIKR